MRNEYANHSTATGRVAMPVRTSSQKSGGLAVPDRSAGLVDLRPLVGKLQKRIQRVFIAKPGARLTTVDLVRWCQPRLTGEVKNKHRLGIRRAAPAVAVKVGRTYPGGFIWMGKDSYQPSGDTSQPLPSDDDRE